MAEPRVKTSYMYDGPFTESEEATEDFFEATETYDSLVMEAAEEIPLAAQETLIEESIEMTAVIGSDSDEVALSTQTEDGLNQVDKSSSVLTNGILSLFSFFLSFFFFSLMCINLAIMYIMSKRLIGRHVQGGSQRNFSWQIGLLIIWFRGWLIIYQ
jgi:hypothetical protein